MKTPEQIMTEFANEHSYTSWSELMYDSHDDVIKDYTKEVMQIYALQILEDKKKNILNYNLVIESLKKDWNDNNDNNDNK